MAPELVNRRAEPKLERLSNPHGGSDSGPPQLVTAQRAGDAHLEQLAAGLRRNTSVGATAALLDAGPGGMTGNGEFRPKSDLPGRELFRSIDTWFKGEYRWQVFIQDLLRSGLVTRAQLEEVAAEYGHYLSENRGPIAISIAAFGVVAMLVFRIAGPPGLVVLLGVCALYGFMKEAEAVQQHGMQWGTAAWATNGGDTSPASKELIRVVVSFALALANLLGVASSAKAATNLLTAWIEKATGPVGMPRPEVAKSPIIDAEWFREVPPAPALSQSPTEALPLPLPAIQPPAHAPMLAPAPQPAMPHPAIPQPLAPQPAVPQPVLPTMAAGSGVNGAVLATAPHNPGDRGFDGFDENLRDWFLRRLLRLPTLDNPYPTQLPKPDLPRPQDDWYDASPGLIGPWLQAPGSRTTNTPAAVYDFGVQFPGPAPATRIHEVQLAAGKRATNSKAPVATLKVWQPFDTGEGTIWVEATSQDHAVLAHLRTVKSIKEIGALAGRDPKEDRRLTTVFVQNLSNRLTTALTGARRDANDPQTRVDGGAVIPDRQGGYFYLTPSQIEKFERACVELKRQTTKGPQTVTIPDVGTISLEITHLERELLEELLRKKSWKKAEMEAFIEGQWKRIRPDVILPKRPLDLALTSIAQGLRHATTGSGKNTRHVDAGKIDSTGDSCRFVPLAAKDKRLLPIVIADRTYYLQTTPEDLALLKELHKETFLSKRRITEPDKKRLNNALKTARETDSLEAPIVSAGTVAYTDQGLVGGSVQLVPAPKPVETEGDPKRAFSGGNSSVSPPKEWLRDFHDFEKLTAFCSTARQRAERELRNAPRIVLNKATAQALRALLWTTDHDLNVGSGNLLSYLPGTSGQVVQTAGDLEAILRQTGTIENILDALRKPLVDPLAATQMMAEKRGITLGIYAQALPILEIFRDRFANLPTRVTAPTGPAVRTETPALRDEVDRSLEAKNRLTLAKTRALLANELRNQVGKPTTSAAFDEPPLALEPKTPRRPGSDRQAERNQRLVSLALGGLLQNEFTLPAGRFQHPHAIQAALDMFNDGLRMMARLEELETKVRARAKQGEVKPALLKVLAESEAKNGFGGPATRNPQFELLERLLWAALCIEWKANRKAFVPDRTAPALRPVDVFNELVPVWQRVFGAPALSTARNFVPASLDVSDGPKLAPTKAPYQSPSSLHDFAINDRNVWLRLDRRKAQLVGLLIQRGDKGVTQAEFRTYVSPHSTEEETFERLNQAFAQARPYNNLSGRIKVGEVKDLGPRGYRFDASPRKDGNAG